MRINEKPETKLDLLVHPIRSRLLMSLAGRQMTSKQLAAALPDVPPATLYRHLEALRNGGAIEVVSETHSRGKPEKTYQMLQGGGELKEEDLVLPEARARAFQQLVAGISASYSSHLSSGTPKDEAMFAVPLAIDSSCRAPFLRELRDLLERYSPTTQKSSRRHLFAAFLIPEREEISNND